MALSRKDAATDRQSAIVDSDEDGGWISLYRGDDGAIDTRRFESSQHVREGTIQLG